MVDRFRLTDARELVDCAMGRIPADLIIRNGRWVCVQTGEIIPETEIAVIGGRIAAVGPSVRQSEGPSTQVIDANGRYLVPGLLDAHMHVESGMLSVAEFVRAVLPRGSTGLFIDPHEIANVLGLRGVRLFVDEAAIQPIHVFVQIPSCVPSAPGLETSGAVLGPQEVREALSWPGVIGLGEMMNYTGVAYCDEGVHAKMEASRRAGKVIGGHYPSPDLGLDFAGYVAGGPSDDHEGTRMEDAIARARNGMRAMLRLGSAWHDVAEQVRAVTECGLDPRNFLLCTDDSHSATIINEGHMDRVLRYAIAHGLKPMTAIQMATINTAEYFGVSRELGMIAPQRYADILIVPDLVEMRPDLVIARGKVVAQQGKLLAEIPAIDFPEWAQRTVHLKQSVRPADFTLKSLMEGEVTANVIGIIENQAPTRHMHFTVLAEDGKIAADPANGLAKVAVIERHTASGAIQVGLVHGFGLKVGCGIATTVAHDCHQMIVIGTSDSDMALAANRLAETGGGQAVFKDGQLIGEVVLPIAGLVSNQPAQAVAAAAQTVLEGFRACGCMINNPNMQMSLLALVVIPELRISDKGLVDVNRFQVIDILET